MATADAVSVDLLQGLMPLQKLPQETLAALASQFSIETWSRGRYLFRQGDALEHFVYLLSGQVLLLQDGQEVDILDEGSGAARFALAHHQPRKLSAKAQSDLRLLRIPLYAVPQPPSGAEVVGREEWLTRMLQHWVFQKIPSSHVDTILAKMTSVSVQKGQVIIRQGEPGDYYYVIKQGRCQVTRRVSGSEREVVLAELDVGESFGEMSLLSRGERNATIVMLSAGELLRLTVQDFAALIRDPILKPVQYSQAVQLAGQGAQWLDVRSAEEYQRGSLPGALNMPVQALRSQLDGLAATRRYVVFCADGVASATVAFLMCKRGFDTYLLEGGLTAVPAQAVIVPSAVGGKIPAGQSAEAISMGGDRGSETTERELRQIQAQYERAQAARLAAERARQAEEQESERLRTELAEQMLANQESRILMAEKDKQLAQLDQQVGDLRGVMEQARAEIAKAYAEAEVQMRLRQEEGKFLRTELTELQKRAEKDQRVLQETERRHTQTQAELDKLRDQSEGQVQQLEQALARMSKAHTEAVQELAQEREAGAQKLVPVQQEVVALRQGFAEIETKLRTTETERTQALQELELLWQGALRGVAGDERQRFDLIDARARLSEAAKRQVSLEQQHQAALAEQARLQFRLAELQSQHGSNSETSMAERTELQTRLRALEHTHAETLEALQGANHQVEYFRSQFAQLKQEFDAYRAQLQAREQAIEAELAEARQQQQLAMSNALQFDGLELEKMRREANEAKRQVDDFQRQMNALRKSKAELETEYRLEKEELVRIRQQLEELEKNATKHQEILDQKEGQRVKAEQDNVRLRDQLAMMVAKNQKQSGQLAQQETTQASKVPQWAGVVLGLLLGVALGGGGIWGWMQYRARSLAIDPLAPQGQASTQQPLENTNDATKAAVPAESPTTAQPVRPGPKVLRVFQDRLRSGGEGPRMVALSAGTFNMGRSHPTDTDQQPVREVRLAAFALSQYEVTFADYDRFAKETGRALPSDSGWGRGAQPVINVNWNDAVAYAEWLSQQTGQRYRLPTEAEWEYAAGGGSDALFWWGMSPEKTRANCFNCETGGSGKRAMPVGQIKPNPLQFYDIFGNVKEWLQDCYVPNYQNTTGDGKARVMPDCLERAVRGGAYNTPVGNLRIAKRDHSAADVSADNMGFRVARD